MSFIRKNRQEPSGHTATPEGYGLQKAAPELKQEPKVSELKVSEPKVSEPERQAPLPKGARLTSHGNIVQDGTEKVTSSREVKDGGKASELLAEVKSASIQL